MSVPIKEEEVALTFDADEDPSPRPVKHPVASFFHLFFRVLALLAYAFCGWFSDSYVTSFITVVLLCAFDFWTVKNVTGRLLVGLRWWNEVNDQGETHWRFECRKDGRPPLPSESRLFWASLIACPAIWIFFCISCCFTLKLNWLIVSAVGASMTCANLYGYIRCIQGQKTLKGIATQYLGQQVLNEAVAQALKTDKPPV